MKCLGRTKQFNRCGNESKKMFCYHHRFQPYALIFFIVNLIALSAGLYNDLYFITLKKSSENILTEKEVINILSEIHGKDFSTVNLHHFKQLALGKEKGLNLISMNYLRNGSYYSEVIDYSTYNQDILLLDTDDFDQKKKFDLIEVNNEKHLILWSSQGTIQELSLRLFVLNEINQLEEVWQSFDIYDLSRYEVKNEKFIMNRYGIDYTIKKVDNSYDFEIVNNSKPTLITGDRVLEVDANIGRIIIGNKKYLVSSKGVIGTSEQVTLNVGDILTFPSENVDFSNLLWSANNSEVKFQASPIRSLILKQPCEFTLLLKDFSGVRIEIPIKVILNKITY